MSLEARNCVLCSRRFFDLALPDDKNSEAERPQLFHLLRIPPSVCRKFRHPEFAVSGRHCRQLAALVMMPKTAVDEYGPALLLVREVWRTRQRLDVQPIPQTDLSTNLGNPLFGRRALLADTLHECPTRGIRLDHSTPRRSIEAHARDAAALVAL
jgi:hypothetical protein